MKFKLAELPNIALLEVFSYVHPEELLDYRFLNKKIFEVISNNIHNCLKYTLYYKSNNFKGVQQDYICKKNMNIECLNVHNGGLLDTPSLINSSNTILVDKFKNLNSLHIENFYSQHGINLINMLDVLKELLFKIKIFKLTTSDEVGLDNILLILNPKVIGSLSIISQSSITINNILKFKKFIKLEQLTLNSEIIDISSLDLINDETIVFPSLKYLTIHKDRLPTIDFKLFGDIIKLKTIELKFNEEDDSDYLDLLRVTDSMAHFNLKYEFQLFSDPILNKILERIDCVLNVKGKVNLEFSSMNSMFESDIKGSPLFKNVYELKFSNCTLVLNFGMDLLKYFPNVKKVKFNDCMMLKDTQSSILRLPTNSDQILFFIDSLSLNRSDSCLHELYANANVNTSILYHLESFDL